MTASNPPIALLVLSTAVIAATIGALVSVIIAVWSGWRERVARKRELLLKLSVQMAETPVKNIIKGVELSGVAQSADPPIVQARWHHRQLKLLFETDRLDDDLEKRFCDFINKPHSTL
jgi:hypothetical protein